jgi:2-oxoisovalerate dehydrogenase E1 component
VLLECDTRRLCGHAAYDKGLYVPSDLMAQWRKDDPLLLARERLAEVCGLEERAIAEIEAGIESQVRDAVTRALAVGRPRAPRQWPVHAGAGMLADAQQAQTAKPHKAKAIKNGDAVNVALDYLLANHPSTYLAGMDVGAYGSAFKTCKGLVERYGTARVIDMPLAESSIMGFALGSSQTGGKPIIEFQFADFSTEAVTQLGLNAGTWYFRTGCAAPMLMRLPCGGGLTMGAFHSGEFEGLWSRFPGLKLLYPATPQETYEALIAGFYDPNPCLVFEHKLLYWSRGADIDFDGDVQAIWRPRRYTEGSDLTIVALGAMVPAALAAAAQSGYSVEVWNPFVLQPLDIGPIAESVQKTGRLLVVQESGETQGLGDRLVSLLSRECFHALQVAPAILSSPDVPVPFAPELESVYRPSQEKIRNEITSILGTQRLRKVA